MEITAAEKNILSGITFHTEEIENGQLCDEDKEILTEMRAVAGYFAEKYPSYNFEITGCEPKAGTVRTYNEWYYKVEGIDRESAFIATAEKKDNGDYDIKDDFFGELIKDSMAKEVKRILVRGRFPVIQVNVGFWETLGGDFGEKLSPKDVLSGKINAGNDIKVFLDGSKLNTAKCDGVAKEIENCLLKEGVKGDVYVVVLKAADSDFTKDRLYSTTLYL